MHLPTCDVLLFCHALGGVEVYSGKWQKNVINWHKLSAGATFLVVVPNLHKLRATKGQLREQLLLLVAELDDLLSQLPIEVVALTLCGLGFLVSDIAQNLSAHWAVRGEHLFDGAGGKVNASLGHDGVDNLGGTEEVSTAGGVIPQARSFETLLILLVSLLAGFLVLLDQIKVSHTDLL